jgi:signal transduction histidine kinase
MLANGYLFSSLIVIPHALTFPGAFAPTGLLGAGIQSSGWLNFFWHLGFLAGVAGYAWLKDEERRNDAVQPLTPSVSYWSVAIQVGLVCMLTWALTAGDAYLPRMFLDDRSSTPLLHYAAGTLVAASLLVLLMMWTRQKSVLDLWVMVAIAMVISEMTLVTFGMTTRFSFGWYVSRALAVAFSAVVLIALILESMRSYAELLTANVMLDQARRTKDSLLALASHDLRQPLQTLFLLNGVLRRLPSDPGVATAVAGQEKAIRAMSELLDALLDISKLEAGAIKVEMSDVALAETFRELEIEFAGIAAAKGLQFEVLKCDAIARSDAKLLGQILRNLLGNAVKFTHEGHVRMQCSRERADLRIDVQDTGTGISSEHLPHIFEDFYQAGLPTGNPREGHGLGLAIALRLSRLLGHQITVDSRVGEGSTFSVMLPMGEPRAVPLYKSDVDMAPSGQGHVMVIDDDAGVLSGLVGLLESAGYQVTAVCSIAEAVKRARDNKDIVLLIADYHLGNGELGTEAIRSVRTVLGKKLIALLLTGDTSSRTKQIAREDQVRFISKPVDPDELLRLVARSL